MSTADPTRRAPDRPAPSAPSDAPERHALLAQITDVLTQAEPTTPTAVGVGFRAGDVELAVKPLDTGDVVAALAGFVAPGEWEAFAVVAPATAHRLADGTLPARRRGERCYLGVLAARDGTAIARLVTATGDARSAEGGEGRVLDACRRVVGLPTPPPTHAVAWWVAHHWLDAVLATTLATDLGRPPGWADLADLTGLDAGVGARDLTWQTVRERVAVGTVVVPGVAPVAAAWMDDGMFSREVLGAYPPLPAVVADLGALLPAEVHRRVVERIERTLAARDARGRGGGRR